MLKVVVVVVVVNKAEVGFLHPAAASPRKRISNVEPRNCIEERCPLCSSDQIRKC